MPTSRNVAETPPPFYRDKTKIYLRAWQWELIVHRNIFRAATFSRHARDIPAKMRENEVFAFKRILAHPH
ncbi:hypothetical protein ACRQ1B_03175 [Rhizobium panacihumi]|uniref:hypothetical protein n=1 Tax=Rhizobium panacihumi TaxID=2008450 RepID=UPI003D78B38D